jgi:hypothetical protein
MTVNSGNVAPAAQGVTPDNAGFLDQLRTIVGHRHVLTGKAGTRRYRTGFRFGNGPALAVVRPGGTVLHGDRSRKCAGAIPPNSVRYLSDTDILRVSERQHPVQGRSSDGDLGRLGLAGARSKRIPNHALVSADRCLDFGP